MPGDALIDALIPAADQQQFLQLAELPGPRLVELRTLRREQNHFLTLASLRPDRLDRLKNRAGLHQHAFAAAKRPIVHSPMPVARQIAQVVHADFNQSRRPGLAYYALLEGGPEKIRENRQDVKNHLPIIYL